MPYWRLFYHFRWGTKLRQSLISADFEASLHNVIAAKATALGGRVYAVGGVDNHVHLVVSVPPGIALSDFVGQVKGNSSHFVNHEIQPGYQFAWQSEYGVISFSGDSLDVVVKYVKNQRLHHRDNTLQAMFESFEAKDTPGANPPG